MGQELLHLPTFRWLCKLLRKQLVWLWLSHISWKGNCYKEKITCFFFFFIDVPKIEPFPRTLADPYDSWLWRKPDVVFWRRSINVSGSHQVTLLSPDPSGLRYASSHLHLPASTPVVNNPDPQILVLYCCYSSSETSTSSPSIIPINHIPRHGQDILIYFLSY